MIEDAGESDVLRRMRTYDAPPVGFDPHTALDHELRRHGLPRRPDREAEPHLSRIWKRHFEPPLTFVRAELEIDPYLRRRDPFVPLLADDDGQDWAGATRSMGGPGSDYSKPATYVTARWTIPEVSEVVPGLDDVTIGFWVGLDGAGSGELLQAGVAARIEPGFILGSDVVWYAWAEWYTGEYKDPPVRMKNFPVGPNDSIVVLVCAPTPGYGTITMANLTRNIAATVGITGHPDCPSAGLTVEWVVERVDRVLPQFSPHQMFEDCWAGSAGESFNLAGAARMEINDFVPGGPEFGVNRTHTTIVSPETVTIDWHGGSSLQF